MSTALKFDPQKLLDDMVTFVAVLDISGEIVFVNNTPLIASGITLDEIVGIKFWDAVWWAYSDDAINRIREDAMLCATGQSILHEIQLATADGSLIWIEYSMHPILDDAGNVEYLVPEGRDITEKKQQQQQMQRLAHYDTLTGLPNRTLFNDRFHQAIAHSHRHKTILAVCFLDIDHFKPINDNYGHEEGDKLLVEVSSRLMSLVREEDTVSRMGGDEFTLLLGDINSDHECAKLINRILCKLSQSYSFGQYTHNITVSCGISLYPNDNSAADLLIRHADQAMYQAKVAGKNRLTFFDPTKEQLSQDRASYLSRVTQAITTNELILFYQPKINMQTGLMYGLEALIRWQHPRDGLLFPIKFLPYIEKTKVMIAVGNWVISQALSQLEIWHEMGKDWSVSINIDAYHLMDTDFIGTLRTLINQHPNVPPKMLEIEILETVNFSDLTLVTETILKCQSFGVCFSLDDFGTGYSSLTYLKEFPIQCLKIDQTFVRDILSDEKDRALIEGIIALSKAFKINIIAEGVETIGQGDALLQLGCHHAQGNAIAKPMPANEIVSWEDNYQPEVSWSNK